VVYLILFRGRCSAWPPEARAVVDCSDWYEAHYDELLAELRAIDRRRELTDKFQAEWN
jgi:hypothetical protein